MYNSTASVAKLANNGTDISAVVTSPLLTTMKPHIVGASTPHIISKDSVGSGSLRNPVSPVVLAQNTSSSKSRGKHSNVKSEPSKPSIAKGSNVTLAPSGDDKRKYQSSDTAR